jgi:hypothetical protein
MKTSEFKALERRIRLSKAYSDWVQRNLASTCLCCGGTERLECHHVVELYSILHGLWKLYGDDPEKMYAHAIAMHDNDMCESSTMCTACHAKRHPGRNTPRSHPVYTDDWTAVARNFNLNLFQGKQKPRGHLGLIGFQTLLGIGWYILNGHLEARMVKFNRRRFAELLGKIPSVSFNNSLTEAIRDLKVAGVLYEYDIEGNKVELHLSEEYLNMLAENPWFIPFRDVKTSKPCVLALKWWLGVQSDKTIYRISLDKLVKHIGIHTNAHRMAARALRLACKHIKWAKVVVDKGNCEFTLKKRGSTPIFSLRDRILDAVQKGK